MSSFMMRFTVPWEMGVPLTTLHCRTSPTPEKLGWINTSAQSETFGANSNGVSVKELAGPPVSASGDQLISAAKTKPM